MKIYGFFYNDNIHESSPTLMALRFKKKAAEIEMKLHKEASRVQFQKHIDYWNEIELAEELRYPFGNHENWMVWELEVK